MKHLIITTLITLCLSFSTLGQGLGLKVGAGISRYNLRQVNFPTYVTQYEKFTHYPTLSLAGGFSYKVALGENFGFSCDFGYTKKGNREYTIFDGTNASTPDTLFETTTDNTMHLHYIELSPRLHISKINLFFGGYVSYLWLISSKYYSHQTGTYKGNEYLSETHEGRSIFQNQKYDYFKPVDFGILVGYQYRVNPKMRLELSYHQGLPGILQNDFFINYRNSQLLLLFVYQFSELKESK